jgi:hypothetical protein
MMSRRDNVVRAIVPSAARTRARGLAVFGATAVSLSLSAAIASPAGAVIGGQDAGHGAFGAAAQVVQDDRLCSGTLIAPRLVLTARHCRAGRDAHVRIGNPNHGLAQIRRGVGELDAPQVQPPPGVTGAVDAAVVVLDRSASAAPMALAPAAEAAGLTTDGATLLIAGFGERSSRPGRLDVTHPALREASVIAASCLGLVAGADGSPYAACARPAPAAAAFAAPGNPCAGDSGAAVIAFSPALGSLVVAGLLSGGAGTRCARGTPTIFTPLQPLLEWLAQVEATALPRPAAPPAGCAGERADLRRSAGRLSVMRRRHALHPRDRRLLAALRHELAAYARLQARDYARCQAP